MTVISVSHFSAECQPECLIHSWYKVVVKFFVKCMFMRSQYEQRALMTVEILLQYCNSNNNARSNFNAGGCVWPG